MKTINIFLLVAGLLLIEFLAIPNLCTDQNKINLCKTIVSFVVILLITFQIAKKSHSDFTDSPLITKTALFLMHLGFNYALVMLISICWILINHIPIGCSVPWSVVNAILLIGSLFYSVAILLLLRIQKFIIIK